MSTILTGRVETEIALGLFGDNVIEFDADFPAGKQRYVPDATKAYFTFTLSHAFPVITALGTALHPNVVSRSYPSLLNQNINFEHQIAVYHPDRDVRDRVIGSVVAVKFPRPAGSRWSIQADPAKSPGIEGVGVLFKQTQGMTQIIGQHATGRHHYVTSMEVSYAFEESGFAVASKDARETPGYAHTPDDMKAIGYEYFPWDKSPEELKATFSKKKERIVCAYQGRGCVMMMGGIENSVHYLGMGIVKYGAEATADITRMAASHPDATDMAAPFEALVELLAEALNPPS